MFGSSPAGNGKMKKKYYNNYKNNERTLEQELAESEMCDVCGKSYNYNYIKRIPYIGKM